MKLFYFLFGIFIAILGGYTMTFNILGLIMMALGLALSVSAAREKK